MFGLRELIGRIASKRAFAVVVGSAVLFSQPLSAQTAPGFYVSGSALLNLNNGFDGEQGKEQITTQLGAGGTVAFGYAFASGFRAELEGNYRSNDVTAIRIGASYAPSGAIQNYGVMANALYDLPIGRWKLPFKPYVGAGIGYDTLDLSSVDGVFSPVFNRTFGSVGVFAYQAIVGASIPIGSVPGLEATLEYRYFGTMHGNAHTTLFFRGRPDRFAGADFDVSANSVSLGLRYALFQPRN